MLRTVIGVVLVAAVAGVSIWLAKSAYDKTRQPGPVVNRPVAPPAAAPEENPNPSPSPSPQSPTTNPEATTPPAATGLIEYQPDGTFGGELGLERMGGIALDSGYKTLAVCSGGSVVLIDLATGKEISRVKLPAGRSALSVDFDLVGGIYVGEDNGAEKYRRDQAGQYVREFEFIASPGETLGRVTAIHPLGMFYSEIVAADADQRRLLRFDPSGKALPGRIPTTQVELGRPPRQVMVPNDTLDFAEAPLGLIVMAHPGRHLVQTYNLEGKKLAEWGRFDEHAVDGFTGCCNPINVAVFPLAVLGRPDLAGPGLGIVTAEKGPPRVKVYDESGEMLALIDSSNFDEKNRYMYLAVDASGRIYVADTEAKIVRRFRPNPKAESK